MINTPELRRLRRLGLFDSNKYWLGWMGFDIILPRPRLRRWLLASFIGLILIIIANPCLAMSKNNVPTKGIYVEMLANAIFRAEGGTKTRHPYGILKVYKHTNARTACINSIKHRLKDWNGQGDFIAYLQKFYCPLNCDNDNGTNQYWAKNVQSIYNNLRKGM